MTDDPARAATGVKNESPAIAPIWHTLLLVLAVLAVSVLGLRIRSHPAAASLHRVREYLLTLGWEWALAAAVVWGLWLRRVPLRVLLGEWRQDRDAWLRDVGIALAFWVASALVLACVGVPLRWAHLKLPEGTVAALAPRTVSELVIFLALSLSAGCCEELLFRGYFQQQFLHLAGGRAWCAVLASAMLFGCAHLYEGAAGVILIAIFGVLFSLLALQRRSLRPGMISHAWHDGVSGLVLFVLQRAHLL